MTIVFTAEQVDAAHLHGRAVVVAQSQAEEERRMRDAQARRERVEEEAHGRRRDDAHRRHLRASQRFLTMAPAYVEMTRARRGAEFVRKFKRAKAFFMSNRYAEAPCLPADVANIICTCMVA